MKTERLLEQGKGILRLAPNWVPRAVYVPGRRLKLHPDDLYSFGADRGGIDERWLASATPADNGPKTTPDEGLSRVVSGDGKDSVLLRDLLDEMRIAWPVYAKFFDNRDPIPFHVHQRDEQAAAVGMKGKPEAYFFPTQMNNHTGSFPYTFFGLRPGTTKEQVRACLKNFGRGDNKITALSQAYRLEPGAGWNVPAGVLHAPGSLCTYEPQKASDVYALFQSVAAETALTEDNLWHNTPPEKIGDYDYLIEVLDWEQNTGSDFAARNFMPPGPVRPSEEMEAAGYRETWIAYKSADFSAKELTIFPGRAAVIRDAAAYGLILLQGHGTLGAWAVETPALIRFGQLTHDEFFVSETAAKEGVKISNPSLSEPLVMLKHFGPDNPDLKITP